MPYTDGLAPPLANQAEKDTAKAYGGWTAFSQSYGLKPWVDEDNREAGEIVRGLGALEQNEDEHEADGARAQYQHDRGGEEQYVEAAGYDVESDQDGGGYQDVAYAYDDDDSDDGGYDGGYDGYDGGCNDGYDAYDDGYDDRYDSSDDGWY